MSNTHHKKEWGEYVAKETAALVPVLSQLGFTLDTAQPHMQGERHLTRPLGSGRKLLLLARDKDNHRVVIKASDETAGIRDIEHERRCRQVLERIHFAYQTFFAPHEILLTKKGGYTIFVTEFIEAKPFLDRPLEEQFTLALKAFKAQESAHATTSSHLSLVRNVFGEYTAEDYLQKYATYTQDIKAHLKDTHLAQTLAMAADLLQKNKETIEQYGGFLTHWDFTPQNIRIVGGDIYLLDHSSLHFGNKYEGWARFINFMELYNPPLARALLQYVRDNRTPEESLSLTLMRVYRLCELIRYYVGWLPRTHGALHELAQTRIRFWGTVLRATVTNQPVPTRVVEEYKNTRDSLRSEEEKQRQIGLH